VTLVIVFWSCLAVVLYVYCGYPLLLWCNALGRRRPPSGNTAVIEELPVVSVIIPAHNEAGVISAKLENLLQLDYPKERLEIVVGSDGSIDGTEGIVSRYACHGVRLVASRKQVGKSGIQNAAVEAATGEILLFTDADTLISTDGLLRMVARFRDPSLGLVTVSPRFANLGETAIAENEGLYWKYENGLRRQESDRGLLAAASGSCFAMRRALWRPLDPNVGDDFVLPLQVLLRGYRNVVEERVRTTIWLLQNSGPTMLRMKVRIISKDLRGLIANRAVMNPLGTGPTALALVSHKLLRWLVPYFLIVAAVSNCLLLDRMFYRLTFGAQIVFYATAAVGFALRGVKNRVPFSTVFSFCLVNYAALLGTLHFALGRTTGCWKPVR
jgi:cellulose synthase/poly-beta-1,6-N-acetylglucosamine synthase-like glycosyltransferase